MDLLSAAFSIDLRTTFGGEKATINVVVSIKDGEVSLVRSMQRTKNGTVR